MSSLSLNLGTVNVIDTGKLSKGGKRIAKSEVVLPDGTKVYISAFVPAGVTDVPKAQAVAPTVRKGKAAKSAPVTPAPVAREVLAFEPIATPAIDPIDAIKAALAAKLADPAFLGDLLKSLTPAK